MATEVINGTEGAKHVVNGPLTTAITNNASESLLLSEIDSRIVKIRPSATPIDQISRLAGARRAGAMKVAYYSVDTKPTEAKCGAELEVEDAETPVILTTDNDKIFGTSETLLCPDTLNSNGEPLVLYVTKDGSEGKGLTVLPVNLAGRSVTIPLGSKVIRMGRAATELDVQTAQFEALPVKAENYCQIFKAQVEESTLQSLTNKEVGWTFNDQEEVAVIDMRQGIEKNFLFGHRAILTDPLKREDVMLTGGIWGQAGKDFEYDAAAGKADNDFVVSLTRKAFEGHAGSRRKVLVAGSGLIDYLNRSEYVRAVGPGASVTRWGIDFTELKSKFGTLYVVHSQTFDDCGYEGNGMVIDPEYLTKYSFIPMSAERLDLKGAGVRNTDAVVITEASCLVLRYPKAHMRITATA